MSGLGPGADNGPAGGIADARRRELTEAAVEVYAERGYSDATIEEITTRAGVSKGTFYQYFRNKREMLDSVFDYIIEETLGSMGGVLSLEPVDNVDDFVAYLKDMNRRLVTVLTSKPALFRVAVKEGMHDDEIEQRILGMIEGVAALASVIAERQRQALCLELDSVSLSYLTVGTAAAGLIRFAKGDLDTQEKKDKYLESLTNAGRLWLAVPDSK